MLLMGTYQKDTFVHKRHCIKASFVQEKRKRQQKVDTFIDSYKRKRHAPASQASAGRCGDVQFRSGQRESLPATSAFVVLRFLHC